MQADHQSQEAETGRDEVLRQARLLAGIDRYLLAAGVAEVAERHRLVSEVSLRLKDGGTTAAGIDWRAVIDACDAVLAGHHGISEAAEMLPACHGRVVQGLAPDLASSAEGRGPLAEPCDWGTPPSMRRAMPAQDLSIWRPKLPRLAVPQSWRQAQTLVVALCCLAVALLP